MTMRKEESTLDAGRQLGMLKELYREELLANQNDWLTDRISKAVPDLEIRIPSPEAGWSWTYRCTEQESDCCETAMDALLDFLKVQLSTMDKAAKSFYKEQE